MVPPLLAVSPDIKLGTAETTLRAFQTNNISLISVPFHDNLATGVTNGALTLMPGNIAGIDELQIGFPPDIIGVLQRGYRGRRQVRHIMMRVKSGHVPRCQLTKLITYPASNALKLPVIIIHGRDDIGDNLDVHIPLVLSPLGNLKYSLPAMNPGQLPIKSIREAFNINTPGIQVRSNGIQCLSRQVTRIMANASILKERKILNNQKIANALFWYLIEE